MPASFEDDRRLAVRVTADAARQVRGGHPWVFDGSITSDSLDAPAGTLAVVFDPKREFAGIGLWDPGSPIRVKVLHHGSSTPIDPAFWKRRVEEAVAKRTTLRLTPHLNAYRCIHGEADGFPGLVLDRYADTFVLKVYTAAWLPHLPAVTKAIGEVVSPASLVLRSARNVTLTEPWSEGCALIGPAPEGHVRIKEHGLRYDIDVLRGQKTGHFLDQRDNRLLVRSYADRRRVLDVFCANGGFSVNAALGGAVSVHGVDSSEAATIAARHHMAVNGRYRSIANCRYHTTTGDAFEVLEALAQRNERFDLVILDPPSFASRKDQVEGALHAYRRLTSLALPLIEPGGLLFQASCTSRVSADELETAMRAGARGSGRRLDILRHTGQPTDHPVTIPELAYLKAVLARVYDRDRP